jgi:hypothetical protein
VPQGFAFVPLTFCRVPFVTCHVPRNVPWLPGRYQGYSPRPSNNLRGYCAGLAAGIWCIAGLAAAHAGPRVKAAENAVWRLGSPHKVFATYSGYLHLAG